jgi:serine/threonine-protein kinase
MRAEPVDERSDIWGLGAILFEMLTGRPPFIGDTLPEVYSAVLNEAPPGVDTLRSGVPGGLDDVVQRCLEKDPAQRFCDVADLAEALAPYAGSAAQLVERVTRILTNPEAVRARYSLPPIADLTGARAALEGSALGADVHEHGFGMRGGHDSGEAIMANGENGADGGRKRPNADISPGGTLLESDSDDGAAAGQRRSWRPSRPPLSGEFAPFSATGVHAGRPARRARSRLAWLVAALALVAGAGSFWMLDASRRRPAPPVAPVVQVLPVPTPQPVPVEPRVTPIVEAPRAVAGSSQPLAETAGAVQTRAQALQPLPRAKPEPPSSAVPSMASPRSAASSAAGQAAYPSEPSFEEPAVSGEATAPLPRPAVPARALPGRNDDPWDPDSFGDRR